MSECCGAYPSCVVAGDPGLQCDDCPHREGVAGEGVWSLRVDNAGTGFRTADVPSPHKLYEQTGGGDAYRIAMLEHGYTAPTAPWQRKAEPGSGRMLQCGNVHPFNWSEWRHYAGPREFDGRWCRTCGTTQATSAPFRRAAAADLEGTHVASVEFLGDWVYLHLAHRGTDDGRAVVRVPLDARHGPLSKLQPAPGIYFAEDPPSGE